MTGAAYTTVLFTDAADSMFARRDRGVARMMERAVSGDGWRNPNIEAQWGRTPHSKARLAAAERDQLRANIIIYTEEN